MKWHQIQAELATTQQWDGKLPVLGGQKAFPFINLGGFLEKDDVDNEK